MDIVSPDGLTLWYHERLTGNYEISYKVQVVMEEGRNDRLSDLNCFWGANDPLYPDHFFTRKNWRNGIFENYNSLNLFYVGYGGNENKTTRFREYNGNLFGQDKSKLAPIIKEYTDTPHLLKGNDWYEVRIRVENHTTTYSINNKELFRREMKDGKGEGHFALRLWKNHIRLTDFKIRRDLSLRYVHPAQE